MRKRFLVRQTEFFKTIRAKVSSRDAVFALLRDMEEDIDTFLSLTQPSAKWTAERIKARQRWMANQATAIWRVDQLS